MNEVVLVTGPEFVKAEGVFRSEADFEVRSAPVEEAWLAKAVRAAGCRALIIGTTPYVGALYEALGDERADAWSRLVGRPGRSAHRRNQRTGAADRDTRTRGWNGCATR